ncbi:unnamed protein product [Sphenostylis stenocarpa]|uniref:Cytochrome P450 n=1 Tax=Sphenostylis stenocarpa TaxID=92480 RepID=A0AA86SNN5_9FABA|nr:unnamed protein product [Sphenostylis stenocarpa]
MFPLTLLILLAPLVSLIYILHTSVSRRRQPPCPPGPPRLPIIGNLHIVGGAEQLPHRSLQSLAQRYGPIMSLQLGNVSTVVVSSPEAAELFLETHDVVFANRPKFETAHYTYGAESVAFAEYGAYWRGARKVCITHLLSASKVESFGPLRKREVGALVERTRETAEAREVVDLTERVGEVMRDIACKMVLGRNKDDRFDLKGILLETMSISGAFNFADYVPWLRPFDLQGLRQRSKKISKALDKMLEEMIEEHQLAPKAEGHLNDFIDTLLLLKDQPMHPHVEHASIFDKRSIKGIVFDMIIGASETSGNVIEWAISELVRHPRVMESLQQELKHVVGINKMVEEIDLAKLSYLDMVVKETLRLHPVVPLLAPHESMEDIVIEGYYIKKKSRIIINARAIGRDPKVWSENAQSSLLGRYTHSSFISSLSSPSSSAAAEMEDDQFPQIKGVVIISLPPPDNPSLGKTITAFTFSDPSSPQPSLLQQSNQHQTHLNDHNNIDPPIHRYPSNPQLSFSLRRFFHGTPAKFFSFFGVLLFALFLYGSVSSTITQELRGPKNDDDDDGKPGSYFFPLYPKFGVLGQKDLKLQVGKLVRKEKFLTQRKDGVGSEAVAVDSSSVFPVSGNVYPDGYNQNRCFC